MQKRKFDELISHFNRKVSEMSIEQKYKMELLGMITAIGFAHEKELSTNLASLGTDCISRQTAIDALCNDYCGGRQDCKHYPKCENLKAVQNLPSAQPEILACGEGELNVPDINVGDMISRQAAIDALRTCYDTETVTMDNGDEYINYGDAVGEIEQLPPIQPKLLQPWEVLVAQAVLSQPAEPKRGKWIIDRSGAYCCSECMEPCAGHVMMKPRDKFCKMCGAKMEVTE